MGEKKSFYAKLFNYLLKMLNKYYSSGSIPFGERQEYEFIRQYHKDLEELLNLGKCSLTAEIYRMLCNAVQCRQLPFCSDPKGMLSEIWREFAFWINQPYDDELQKKIIDDIEAFCKKWNDLDIAAGLIIVFAGEVEENHRKRLAVA